MLFLSSHMAIKPYKFTRNYINQEVLELTVSQNVSKNNLYVDLLTGITDSTVTMQYPLNKEELHQYKEEFDTLDYLIGQYGLKDNGETRYHISNILYFIIEFRMKHEKLLKKKRSKAMAEHNVQFLQLVKGITDFQKQKVKMSFLIKSKKFTFDNSPILSEIVMNKITGILLEEVKNLHPEQWAIYKGGKPTTKRKTSDSKLRNDAVVEISKLLIIYLNEESKALCNHQPNLDKLNVNAIEGNFIYDVLTLFKLYRPTEAAAQVDKNTKLNYGESLRKLIERARK